MKTLILSLTLPLLFSSTANAQTAAASHGNPELGVNSKRIAPVALAGNQPYSGITLGLNGALNGFVPQMVPELLQDISAAPVDTAHSTAWQNFYCNGGCDGVNIDHSMPYSVVDTTVTVPFSSVAAEDESDMMPVPITTSTPTENGILGVGSHNTNEDHHSFILNRANGQDYEIYQTKFKNGKWSAYSLTVWNMAGTERRPFGFTSADAAGLPIFPALLRYDEIIAGSVNHALRVTFNNTSQYVVFPSTHAASDSDTQTAYLGMRIRLRASFSDKGYSATNKMIIAALKKYGAIIADNGCNMCFQATLDNRWDGNDLLNLSAINESDFDVVQSGAIMNSQAWPVGLSPIVGSFTAVHEGSSTVLSWNVSGDSYDYIQEVGPVTGTSSVTVPYVSGTSYTLVSNNQYGRVTKKSKAATTTPVY